MSNGLIKCKFRKKKLNCDDSLNFKCWSKYDIIIIIIINFLNYIY